MRASTSFGVLAGLCLATSIAVAVRTPDYLTGEDPLVAADGRPLRTYRPIQWDHPPVAAATAWKGFTAAHPGSWRVAWDAHTGVPHRLYGTGIPAPGAMASPATGERSAAALLVQHIDLLAPGSLPADFRLIANHASAGPRGLRSVGYQQLHRGMPVLGGLVSFRFKNDRAFVMASTALPHVNAPVVALPVAADRARAAAAAWIADRFGGAPIAGTVDGPMVLPLITSAGAIDYRTVLRVRVDLIKPLGRWDVYVDAASAAPVAREQRLMFGSATMQYDAPVRWWGDTRQNYPAYGASLLIGGTTEALADDTGLFSWTGTGSVEVTARAFGPLVAVYNQAGTEATWATTATSAGSLIWSDPDTEFVDAQISGYIHGQVVKKWASRVSDITFLTDQLEVNVNINDTCNAFSDGTTINFFRASDGCGNTARIADIVYHEFGHSFHNHGIIEGVGNWDGHLSEGLGDFVSATLTGSPEMGPGFFATTEPLRHCDPLGMEFIWPDDVGEVHDTGRIYCGAMFDLRKNLVSLLGQTEGVDLTDELFYESFRRAQDIPSTYTELLAWDDDNGDLADGTPHKCEIDDAYARHGLAEPGSGGPRAFPPSIADLTVNLPVTTSAECPNNNITGAMLEWRLRADTSITGQVAMAQVTDAFEGAIPRPPWGSVVQYRVIATPQAGEPLAFPNNPADPWYELFYGEVTVLYCTDFETDPTTEGWTHELVSGTAGEGADDWMWGTSFGQNGDPGEAYSGVNVYGNDLGPEGWNGQYQNDKHNRTTMPAVDTMGFDVVRLQYRRWLNVEDGSMDKAFITAGGTEVWSNLAAEGATHHVDSEWRFHDVDLTSAVVDGSVQVAFELQSDQGLAFGGWTLEDVCIVGYMLPVCGDGELQGDEACDDGNTVGGDGCSATCALPACGDGFIDDGETCDDGNVVAGDGCSATCTIEDDGGGEGDESGGCCRSSTGPGGWLLAGLALLALIPRRRRR